MVNIRRRLERTIIDPPAGPAITLVAATWTTAIGVRGRGAGLSYRRPMRLEIDGLRRRVRAMPDYVMAARLVVAIALGIAHVARRRQS